MKNNKSIPFFITLISVTAAGPVAMQLYIPSVPVITKDFQVSLGIAQFAFSISLVTMAISMLFYGPLSDKYGRKFILICGILIFIIGSFIALYSNNIISLILGRIIQSIGGAGGLVISRAIVRDIYGPKEAARVLGTLITIFIAAPMLAVIVGGFLSDYYGWRSIFILTIFIGIIILLLIIFCLPEMKKKENEITDIKSTFLAYMKLLKSPIFLGFAMQGAFAPGAFMSFMAVGPYLMIINLERPASEFGIYFGIVTLIFMFANYIGGKYSRQIGIEKMVLIGAIISVIAGISGLTLYLYLGLSVLLMFTIQTLSSIGNGIAMPSSQIGAMNVKPSISGTASGAAAFFQTIMGAIFAQTVSSIDYNMALILFIATLIAAIGAILFGSIPMIKKLNKYGELN
ncbi:MAG: Bicyclomycin resistance protein [Alphaproteobacteria bacterium MarineAlpha2_Bin1]|nr:MAG: Bicyclomycin resistance protein [Alphaproteobacteria bacterium MarineAlpha2_Bin1]